MKFMEIYGWVSPFYTLSHLVFRIVQRFIPMVNLGKLMQDDLMYLSQISVLNGGVKIISKQP